MRVYQIVIVTLIALRDGRVHYHTRLRMSAWIKKNSASPLFKRNQLVATLSTLLSSEFRNGRWPQFLPEVLSLVQSEDHRTVYAGLLALQELMKIYQYKDKREEPDEIMAKFLPSLHAVVVKVAPMNDYEAGEMVKTAFKIYYKSVQVVEKPLPADMPGMPQDPSEREFHPWWKAKKWAYACLNILFYKWADKRSLKARGPANPAFADMFMEHFAPGILTAYLKQVEQCIAGVWMSPRVKQKLCVFLKDSVNRKITWKLMKPHLEPIVAQFIFPLMCFSDEDEELWQEDSVEFIRKKLDDVMEEFRSPVAAAEDLLFTIVESRTQQTFLPIVTLIQNILATYEKTPLEQRNPRHKDGALKMMSSLSPLMLEDDSPVKDQMEQFIVVHILPELKSPHGFLRARACETILCFDDLQYKNEAVQNEAFQAVLQCMQDPELPVAVFAALALKHFFRVPSIFDAMKQHVQSIMQVLLNLSNQVDLEALANVMDDLVERYAAELTPFATQLGGTLREQFLRIMGEVHNADADEDGMEDKIQAAESLLNTIYTLIVSMDSSPHILAELEAIVAPAIKVVFENNDIDLYPSVVELIEALTYCSKVISPVMWEVFDLLYAALKSTEVDATDYINEFTGCLDNFVSYGKDVFARSSVHQEKLFDVIRTVLGGPYDRFSDEDRCRSAELVECVLMHLKGAVDTYVPPFLEFAFMFLQDPTKSKNRTFRQRMIAIVVNALYYNPIATLTLLEQRGATTAFFQLWFQNLDNFKRVHDKKLCVVTLTTILELPLENMPPTLQGPHWTQLLHGVLKVFESLPSAIEARAELERRMDSDEDDDEVEPEDDKDISGADDALHQEDADDDVLDEEDKYLVYLDAFKESQASRPPGTEDDDELEELEEEDLSMETPLDPIDPYIRMEHTIQTLSTRPDTAPLLAQSLSPDLQAFVQGILKVAGENRAKALKDQQEQQQQQQQQH
ncbi:hypothetical protein HK104_004639 [Borealophlyctis nickersoniae]|nr:hypothetical protein HK104_004639 [Borealophlyctis nickersoniae]